MKSTITLEKGNHQKQVEVEACNAKQAKAQAVLQNPGYRATDHEEVKQPDYYWRKQS